MPSIARQPLGTDKAKVFIGLLRNENGGVFGMKKRYSDPLFDVLRSASDCVIRTSGGGVLVPDSPNDDDDWENAPIP